MDSIYTILGCGYAGLVAVMGLITFACYGWDKHAARRQRPRIPENRLHLLALCGGWLGALIGRAYFRHKTQKTKFTIITWTIASLHIALMASLALFWIVHCLDVFTPPTVGKRFGSLSQTNSCGNP